MRVLVGSSLHWLKALREEVVNGKEHVFVATTEKARSWQLANMTMNSLMSSSIYPSDSFCRPWYLKKKIPNLYTKVTKALYSKDIKYLFITIQQVEVSLIKRAANSVVKGRSGKWRGASFVGKMEKGKRMAGCYSWTVTSKTVVICLQLERHCSYSNGRNFKNGWCKIKQIGGCSLHPPIIDIALHARLGETN